jgi:short-subunit dehydrogenase
LKFPDGIDAVINCVGTNEIRPFGDLDFALFLHLMQINTWFTIELTQQLLPAMVARGTLLHVVSNASHVPMRHSLAYNCSKAAQAMAVRQMARELSKPAQVSIMGVSPGKLSGTAMSTYIDRRVCEVRGWNPQQAADYFSANSVTGLETPAETVAQVIETLIRSGASRFMSGAVLEMVG